MHIVSAADDNYLPHFGAMLHSAWLYHPHARFYLLDSGLSETNRALLAGFASAQNIDLRMIDCAAPLITTLGDIPKRAHYARLFIPEILKDLDRALYLDADITVIGKLDELFATDLNGRPFGAAYDVPWTEQKESEKQGIDFAGRYFNSGVLLLDLKQWRLQQIANRVFDYARANFRTFFLSDQSALNALFSENYTTLDPRWNFFKFHEHETVEDARVIHYNLYQKPWLYSDGPFAPLYKFHRDCTPWPLSPRPPLIRASDRPLNRLNTARRTLLATLGVKHHRRWLKDRQRETQRLNDEQRMMDLVRAKVAAPALERAREMAQQRKHQGYLAGGTSRATQC
jgi:hypothetical protein